MEEHIRLDDPLNQPSPFNYKCSICSQVVNADEVQVHTEEHRRSSTWRGSMSWTLVEG